MFRELSFAPLMDDERSRKVFVPTALVTVVIDCDADRIVKSQGR